MNAKKIIDLTYLKSISNGSDLFIERILQMLLEQTRLRILRLEERFNNRDWKGVQSAAHQLKASFVFMGVKELPDIVNTVEEYASNNINLDLVPEMIFTIKDATIAVIKELEQELSSQYKS